MSALSQNSKFNPAHHSTSCGTDCVSRECAAGLLRNFIDALDAEPAQREPFMNYARSLAEHHLAAWDKGATVPAEPVGSHGAGSAQKVRTSPFWAIMLGVAL